MRVRSYLALASGAVIVAVLAALWLGVPGARAGGSGARHGAAATCGKPARASGHESLARWSRRHHSTVREVLTFTYACGHGFTLRFDGYLNGASARRIMPEGVPLWTLGRSGFWSEAVATARAFCSRGGC